MAQPGLPGEPDTPAHPSCDPIAYIVHRRKNDDIVRYLYSNDLGTCIAPTVVDASGTVLHQKSITLENGKSLTSEHGRYSFVNNRYMTK